MPQRKPQVRDTFKAAVTRLVEAAQALLDNLADADPHIDMDGNLLPDYEELADAVGNAKVLLKRQP